LASAFQCVGGLGGRDGWNQGPFEITVLVFVGGLSVLQRHFPEARAIATPKSVELRHKKLYPDWASNQTWLMFGLG
jgi:hypothetical protein